MTHFAEQQAKRANIQKDVLWKEIVGPDGGDFLARTGSILRSRNLRFRDNREAFRKVTEKIARVTGHDQRFWTQNVVSEAIISTKVEIAVFVDSHFHVSCLIFCLFLSVGQNL